MDEMNLAIDSSAMQTALTVRYLEWPKEEVSKNDLVEIIVECG